MKIWKALLKWTEVVTVILASRPDTSIANMKDLVRTYADLAAVIDKSYPPIGTGQKKG